MLLRKRVLLHLPKKTPSFRHNENLRKNIRSTLFYESILIQILKMLTLWRRKFFIKWSMISEVIKGYKRFQNHLFYDNFLFNARSFKNFSRMSTLWRHKFFIKLNMTLKVIQGHKYHFYAKIILIHWFMDWFWLKFVWMIIS